MKEIKVPLGSRYLVMSIDDDRNVAWAFFKTEDEARNYALLPRPKGAIRFISEVLRINSDRKKVED